MRSSQAGGGRFLIPQGDARRQLINLLVASVLLLSSCSDEPGRSPNKARYCELAKEFVEGLTTSVQNLPIGTGKIEELIDRNHREFVENFGARFDEIEKVDPSAWGSSSP